MAESHASDSSQYYIPSGSPWPIRASVALFAMMLGAVAFLNDWAGGWVFLPGVVADGTLRMPGGWAVGVKPTADPVKRIMANVGSAPDATGCWWRPVTPDVG